MEPCCVQTIARSCRGEILRGDPQALVCGLTTDSRRVAPQALFVALRGERHDGHNFLSDVAAQGAAAILAERGKLPEPLPACAVVAVGNTRQALGEWAAAYRRQFDLPLIAVAGSNGKTTVKELLAATLGQSFDTLASEASFNNDIGVPLTLLRLERRHQAAVLEVGTNHPGEVASLVCMIRPKFGVLTGLGREHLEFFGDLQGVAEEEGWLAELLPAEGKLFLHGDGPLVDAVIRRCRASVVRVGWGPGNHWRARRACVSEAGTGFSVEAPRPEYSGDYHLRLLGRHQVTNALLALAVGAELGMERAALERGLASCLPPKMRLQCLNLNGVHVLNDAYNANADSMRAALETLRDIAAGEPCMAVLGDMAEGGALSAAAHREVAEHAVVCGVSRLIAVGNAAPVMAAAARRMGLSEVAEFAEVEEAAETAAHWVRQGDYVLVKASRVMRLERVVDRLRRVGEPADSLAT